MARFRGEEYLDEEDILGVEKKHKRKVVERNMEELDMKVQVEQAPINNKEVVEPSKEVVVVESEEKIPEKEQKEKEKKLVWYDEILSDLRLATFLDDELTDEEKEKRREAANKLRDKGVSLPPLSIDIKDTEAYENRKKVRGAVEFLRNPLMLVDNWGRKKEWAMEYLKSIGIGNEKGIECLPGSVENNKKTEVRVDNSVETKMEDRKTMIQNDLIKLTESNEGEDREALILSLESKGVKMRNFLTDLEKEVPGRGKDLMRQLRAVVEVWKMDETKKQEFPRVMKIAEAYARALEIG